MESRRTETDEDSGTEASMSGGPDAHAVAWRQRRIALGLSALAVVLSALALGAALLASGLAPRTLVAQASRGGPVTIGATCTHYPGAQVSISVPGPGTVVVSATVGVGINHTFGLNDTARIVVASSPMDCTLDNYTGFISVPRALSTDSAYFETIPLLRAFGVSGRSTITIYVNGVMDSGFDPRDRFDSASLVATFYPA